MGSRWLATSRIAWLKPWFALVIKKIGAAICYKDEEEERRKLSVDRPRRVSGVKDGFAMARLF